MYFRWISVIKVTLQSSYIFVLQRDYNSHLLKNRYKYWGLLCMFLTLVFRSWGPLSVKRPMEGRKQSPCLSLNRTPFQMWMTEEHRLRNWEHLQQTAERNWATSMLVATGSLRLLISLNKALQYRHSSLLTLLKQDRYQLPGRAYFSPLTVLAT